jgi:predicted enzyme related to lactoylglutathione lyase
MPEVTSYEPGVFCWVDLATSDWKAALEFYTSLFGWESDPMDMGGGAYYVMLKKGGKQVCALSQRQDDNIPPAWNTYVSVASADEATEKAKSLGANVVAPPFDVFDAGRMAVLFDPQGAAFNVWQPIKHIGAQVVNESNTLVWNELLTPDAEPARQFYSALFGWTPKISPEYTEWQLGGRSIGGMMEKKDMHPVWLPYFAVDDCEATVDKAKSLGAEVHVPPMDIPKVGRFALLGDPQGAYFYVLKVMMGA